MDVNEVSRAGLLKTFVGCRLCVRKCGYALERIDHNKVIETYVERWDWLLWNGLRLTITDTKLRFG